MTYLNYWSAVPLFQSCILIRFVTLPSEGQIKTVKSYVVRSGISDDRIFYLNL